MNQPGPRAPHAAPESNSPLKLETVGSWEVMSKVASHPHQSVEPACSPARSISDDEVPWVPLGEGKSFKPLRFLKDNRGFVELIRIDPGVEIPLHRHTGAVHAFNLEGTRELCSGEVIGPGGYVYEPPGNLDSWKVIGDVTLVVLVVVMGTIEYLGPDNTVTRSFDAETLLGMYREHCEANGLQPLDLAD
jgi:quercetin dioxygenase-like cupin family protein